MPRLWFDYKIGTVDKGLSLIRILSYPSLHWGCPEELPSLSPMNSLLFIFNSQSFVLCWKPEMKFSSYSVNFLFCFRSFGSCLKILWPAGWDSFQDIGYCSWEYNKQQNFGDRESFPKGEGSRSHDYHHYYCSWKYENGESDSQGSSSGPAIQSPKIQLFSLGTSDVFMQLWKRTF